MIVFCFVWNVNGLSCKCTLKRPNMVCVCVCAINLSLWNLYMHVQYQCVAKFDNHQLTMSMCKMWRMLKSRLICLNGIWDAMFAERGVWVGDAIECLLFAVQTSSIGFSNLLVLFLGHSNSTTLTASQMALGTIYKQWPYFYLIYISQISFWNCLAINTPTGFWLHALHAYINYSVCIDNKLHIPLEDLCAGRFFCRFAK